MRTLHDAVREFCLAVKEKFPEHFRNVNVLDVGSQDINGNNRYLFEDSDYLGIDLGAGDNVDIVCSVHDFYPGQKFDTIISTEAFEHDRNYRASLDRIYDLLKPGGLFLFTCATTGRAEHGTLNHDATSSPYTNFYYHNLTHSDMPMLDKYENYMIEKVGTDIRFYGVKGSN